MNQYFLVPITSPSIKIGGQSLFDKLKETDEELFLRELFRKKITYENPKKNDQEKKFIEYYNRETSEMFNKRGIPEHLVLLKNEEGFFELSTHIPVQCSNESYLNVFSMPGDEIVCFFMEFADYTETVENFFFRKNVIKNNYGK